MASKVIALRGEPTVDEQNTASEAITPGMLIEINAGQWRKHATAAGNSERAFALERDEMGKDIDTAYASGDRVKAGFFSKGQKVNALVATGVALVEGETYLESAGNGLLRIAAVNAATSQAQREGIVGVSAETKTTAATERVKVRVA